MHVFFFLLFRTHANITKFVKWTKKDTVYSEQDNENDSHCFLPDFSLTHLTALIVLFLLFKGSSQRFLEDMKKAMGMSLFENRQLQRSERQLTKNIRTSGLRIRHAIPKDGNCLFHAVADQMDRVGEGGYDHVGLRALAVETLKDGLPGVSL